MNKYLLHARGLSLARRSPIGAVGQPCSRNPPRERANPAGPRSNEEKEKERVASWPREGSSRPLGLANRTSAQNSIIQIRSLRKRKREEMNSAPDSFCVYVIDALWLPLSVCVCLCDYDYDYYYERYYRRICVFPARVGCGVLVVYYHSYH